MSIILRFRPIISHGWRVWKEAVEVAGIPFRISDARKFANGRRQNLCLERETSNQRDPHAIKVIGLYKSWFFNRSAHIGYVPAEDAEIIARRDFSEFLPRLRSIWLGDQTALAIVVSFDILETKKPRTKRMPVVSS